MECSGGCENSSFRGSSFKGLEWVNESLGTNYKLSKIYFVPSDRASNLVYTVLICELIRHYHSGNEFQEMPGLH